MNSILNDPWFLEILPLTKTKFDRKFDVIFENLEKLNLQYYTICETGCIRSKTQFDWQGNFTILANRFTEINNGIVYTVNIDKTAVELCDSLKNVEATCMDSVEYLNQLTVIDNVNLFYLDSMDIDFQNPIPSSVHHYQEFYTIIMRRQTGNFFVCIDDNVSETIQKGWFIHYILRKLNIHPIFESYQTLYWIDNEIFDVLKSKIYEIKYK